MEKEFHLSRVILRNKNKIYYLLIFLFGFSCSRSSKERPYNLLTKYSDLNFNQSNLDLVNYKEEMSGMTKSQGIIEAVFKISNLNIDSLKGKLSDLGYKKMPITELDMGDGFHGNVKQSDSGFYRLNLLHKSIIDVLVIVNFTQEKVLFYKLIQ